MSQVTDTLEITTYEQAMAAWDGQSVLVRSVEDSAGDPVVYVYPQLSRGVSYIEFNLRHEVCLQVFRSEQQALMWARSRGYGATSIR